MNLRLIWQPIYRQNYEDDDEKRSDILQENQEPTLVIDHL